MWCCMGWLIGDICSGSLCVHVLVLSGCCLSITAQGMHPGRLEPFWSLGMVCWCMLAPGIHVSPIDVFMQALSNLCSNALESSTCLLLDLQTMPMPYTGWLLCTVMQQVLCSWEVSIAHKATFMAMHLWYGSCDVSSGRQFAGNY
jgi:hypothetical protein